MITSLYPNRSISARNMRRVLSSLATLKASEVPGARIPRKYSRAEESPLRFEVKEGSNEWSIVLE